jgi:hypothetical protein
MHSFWTLLLAAAAILGLCVWWIRRPLVKARIRFTRIEPNPDSESRQSTIPSGSKAGALTTITAGELRSSSALDRDYILVDVVSGGLPTFSGDARTFVLSITPVELPRVLRWLPADRAVVFRGVSETARALIEGSPCMASSKPRCVVRDLPLQMEVL